LLRIGEQIKDDGYEFNLITEDVSLWPTLQETIHPNLNLSHWRSLRW